MRPRVLVVGDGLVGMSMVLALAHLPVDVIWVGPLVKSRTIRPDDRSIVLNAISQQMLAQWGIWSHLQDQATPIQKVEVSDKGYFGKCRFSAAEAKLPALGYVVPAHALLAALHDGARLAASEMIEGTVQSFCTKKDLAEVSIDSRGQTHLWQGDVVLAADGVHSSLRQMQGLDLNEKAYQQVAITCQLDFGRAHDGCAYERFTSEGPIAMLPRSQGCYGVVWVVDEARADEVCAWSDAIFCKHLQKSFGTKLGLFSQVTPRQHYPLGLKWMTSPIGERVIYCGNAAQTLHPVMGQGFNLGLRDVMTVKSLWEKAHCQQLGDAHRLLAYVDARRSDRRKVMAFSDGVVEGFCNDLLPLSLSRSGLLSLVDLSPTVKRAVARMSMGQSLC